MKESIRESWKSKNESVKQRREENIRNHVTIHKSYTPKTFIQSLLAGGAAGCVAKTTIAPLERTKILFQVSNKPFTLKLAAKKIAQVYREEGITKLWKGNTATVLRVIPYSATQFASFRGYSHLIVADDYTPLTPLQRFIAGAGAGATATIITYPFDFLRTRMAVKEGEQTYKNIVVACKSIYKSEGILTFYTGIYAALFGVLPYSGISWMVFDSSRQFCEDYFNGGKRASPFQRMFCGALAAVVAQTCTYPFDIVRRRMQSEIHLNAPRRYTTILGTLKIIVREEGFRKMWKGITMNWIKGPISMGISFACYEVIER
ncbi:hypothetical protein WA538_001707, partial [Blastocystis sp. DL]